MGRRVGKSRLLVCVMLFASPLAVWTVSLRQPSAINNTALTNITGIGARSESTKAADIASLGRLSAQLNAFTAEAAPLMGRAATLLDEGICLYKGFCRDNPASSCTEVMTQGGVNGKTLPPDGKYWLNPVLTSGRTAPTREVECLMSKAGGGWMLLFDETLVDDITQEFDPVIGNIPVTEMFVFSASGPRSVEGKQLYLYNIDPSQLQHPSYANVGRDMSSMMNQPWVGQDGEGRRSNHNTTGMSLYPHHSQHWRFKYLSRQGLKHSDTVYVLDDGNITTPPSCREGADAAARAGACFHDRAKSAFAYTCYDPKGLISFGCSDDSNTFVHGCGSCLYSGGYGEGTETIQNSVINKMFVR